MKGLSIVMRNSYFFVFLPLLCLLIATVVTSNAKITVGFAHYFFLTLIFLSVLFLSFKKPVFEFLSLINVLFFLGFWMKTSVHIISGEVFSEAYGKFGFTFVDSAIQSANWFGLGLLVLTLFSKKLKIIKISLQKPKINDHISVIGVTFITILFAVLNWNFEFLRVGLPSKVNIPFPFGPLLSWFLGVGSAFLFFLFTQRFKIINILFISVGMTVVSVSTLSRNSIMSFFYPLFLLIFKNRQHKIKALISLVIIFAFFIFSLLVITNLRTEYYSNELSGSILQMPSRSTSHLKGLFIERWLGIEGLLVAKAYESNETFKTILLENQKVSQTSIYQELAESYYPKPGQYLFYTFPGPAGLIFMAKSIPIQILAFSIFSLILMVTLLVIEKFFYGYEKSVICWWAATSLSQISLFPIHYVKIHFFYLFLMILTVLTAAFINNKFTKQSVHHP